MNSEALESAYWEKVRECLIHRHGFASKIDALDATHAYRDWLHANHVDDDDGIYNRSPADSATSIANFQRNRTTSR